MAANDPSAIEAIETNTTICCHSSTMPGNAVSATRVNTAIAATFGAEAKNGVTGVGAPADTSGAHMWNGPAETLKHSPASRNTSPKTMPILPVLADAAMPAKLTVPVKPYTSEAPYSSMPDDSAPSTKYFRPASVDFALSRLLAATTYSARLINSSPR